MNQFHSQSQHHTYIFNIYIHKQQKQFNPPTTFFISIYLSIYISIYIQIKHVKILQYNKMNNRNTARASFIKLQTIYQQSIKQSTQPAWLLSRYHDNSYNPPYALLSLESKYIARWKNIFKNYQSIRPQSNYLLFWNLLIIVAIAFNFYQIPISLFFTSSVYQAQFQSSIGIALNAIFTTILLINIAIIRPLTAYYEQGKLITSKIKIFKKYLKLQLWFNVLAWLVLFVYIFSNNSYFIYAKLLFYLMMLSLSNIDQTIASKLQLWKIRYAFYRFIRLLLMLLFVVLWFSSIFFAIDYMYYQQKNQYYPVNLWLTNSVCSQYSDLSFIDLVQTYNWYVWLNYAFYWTLQSVSMVGYGDITPRNPVEVAYCDFAIVLMTLMYAFFISSVWEILTELFQDQEFSIRKITKYFQKNYKIQGEMAMKLGNYAYEAARYKQREEKQAQIHQNLSDQLKNQLLLARQRKFYVTIKFFNQLSYFSDQYAELLHELAPLTKQVRYGEGQVIFTSQQKNVNLCSILEGEVQLNFSHSKFVKTLEKQNFFYVSDFLYRKSSSYNSKALKFTKLSELSQTDFVNSIRKISGIHQHYQTLYEELIINNRHELTGENCWVCTSNNHMLTACPELFEWLYILRDLNEAKQSLSNTNNNKISFRKYMRRKYRKSKKQLNLKPHKSKKFSNQTILFLDQIKSFRFYRSEHNF